MDIIDLELESQKALRKKYALILNIVRWLMFVLVGFIFYGAVDSAEHTSGNAIPDAIAFIAGVALLLVNLLSYIRPFPALLIITMIFLLWTFLIFDTTQSAFGSLSIEDIALELIPIIIDIVLILTTIIAKKYEMLKKNKSALMENI